MALVRVVGDQVLRGVDVVDDLGDEVGAAGLLLAGQTNVLIAFASVPLGYRDGPEEQVRVDFGAELLGPAQRRGDTSLARGSANEDGHSLGSVLRSDPVAEVCFCVLRRRPVDNDRRAPCSEMAVQVVGWVHHRKEGEWPLVGVTVGLVIDVVEDQAVHAEGPQPLEGDIGYLLSLLR